jgi:flagellar protein FlaG
MSSDIMTNQISKDVLSSSTVAKSSTSAPLENRQKVAVQPAALEGKALPPEADKTEISAEDLRAAVAQLNESVQQIQRDLLFSVDDSSGRTIVRVVNSETDEVVRQMPTEEVLRISRNLKDQVGDITGMIFKTSA